MLVFQRLWIWLKSYGTISSVPFMTIRHLLQHNHACCFFCSVSGLVKAVLCLWKQLGEQPGYCCQCTQYSSVYFQRVNTHSFACIDYHQNKREIVLLLHCFPARLNQFQAVFSHSYFELLRVLNRILYPNIIKEKKYFSALVYILVDSLCLNMNMSLDILWNLTKQHS